MTKLRLFDVKNAAQNIVDLDPDNHTPLYRRSAKSKYGYVAVDKGEPGLSLYFDPKDPTVPTSLVGKIVFSLGGGPKLQEDPSLPIGQITDVLDVVQNDQKAVISFLTALQTHEDVGSYNWALVLQRSNDGIQGVL